MNTKRVLLGCSVISLQDTVFIYPCCNFCLCRLTQEEESNSTRRRCPKCGFTCDTQHVDYRFRLSLKVYRDPGLFGVTVFGGCLNPFFGITAAGLHRFVQSEKYDGPLSLQQLLIKAVEDCFIGKSLVFEFKLSNHDAEICLLGEHTGESVQLVASRVIPHHGDFLGITVFAYLQSLMQENACTDCSVKAGSHCKQNDSPVSSFDHTLPLCQNSLSESSRDALTLPHAWRSMSDLVLSPFPEERTGCSLDAVSEVSLDDESQESLVLQWSNGVQDAKFCPGKPSEAKHSEHNRHSASIESLFNGSSASPIKTTPRDEDSPLSETLGGFVNIEPQVVVQKVFSSTRKRHKATPENNVLLENDTVPRYTTDVQSLHFSLPVVTPLHDANKRKMSLERKKRKQKTSAVYKHKTKLSHFSKGILSGGVQHVVPKRTGGTQVYKTNEQQNQLSGFEDAYNCSVDLFHQSREAESSVSDADPKKQDHIADSESCTLTSVSFQFAPSLQSTPILDPSIQRAQRHKPGKQWSGLHWSNNIITNISHSRVLQNLTNITDGLQVVKSKLNQTCHSDSALETIESSAGGSELKADVKHAPGDSGSPIITNDYSRDLFEPSF